jgi:polysaccharide deacetylase 2 family uncharacterized protein YibQ
MQVFVLCLLFLCLGCKSLQAGEILPAYGAARPTISIIIDDLGNRQQADQRAVTLHGAVTCAFLPHAPHTGRLAKLAYRLNKEIMLHAPMQSARGNRLGAGSLTLDMTHSEFSHTLQRALASVPHVRGINNHMGSLLTRHPGHMTWLMEEIKRHGKLFFVDSRTTPKTVAYQLANENGVPSARRDVFLDASRDADAIDAQFDQLLRVARRRGAALAIGHPYAETLEVLEQRLYLLEEQNVRLIPVSKMIERRDQQQPWPM